MNLGFFLRQNKITRETPLNILSFPTHESQNSFLARTGHNFYLWRGEGIKDWETKYRPLPKNVHLLDPQKGEGQLPPVQFDIILSQNKAGQFPVAQKLSQQLGIPLVCLEHCLPPPGVTPEYIVQTKQLSGHANVFISEFSRNAWGWEKDGIVIRHGIDTEQFTDKNLPRESQCISVVNDWINRGQILGFDLWKMITRGIPVEVWGDTPGLSQPAPSVEYLIERYNSNLVFLNTSIVSPLPMSLVEAAACGCCPISTATCMIPEVFENGKTALLGRTPEELRFHIEFALKNPERARQIGLNAREMIREKFGLDQFTKNWNDLFYKTIKEYR